MVKKFSGRSSMRKRRMTGRSRSVKYRMGKDEKIDYKNFAMLQRFLTDRGKIVSRRINGLTAKQQRELTSAIKYARMLGLLSNGGRR